MLKIAFISFAALLISANSPSYADQFLTITNLLDGPSGSFAGTIGGISVNGSLSSTTTSSLDGIPFFAVLPVGTGYASSVIDGSSPQYSYSNIYSSAASRVDQVGYGMDYMATGSATFTITFSAAVSNLVFQVANLDSSIFDFSKTQGLTGMELLSGNGGSDGDGLALQGSIVTDANPATLVAQDPGEQPLITGPRSAYGSVLLQGTYTSLTIDISRNPFLVGGIGGDGGSFTLAEPAIVPEPPSLVLLASLSPLGFAWWLKRHRGYRVAGKATGGQ